MNKKNILFLLHCSDINNGATRSLIDIIFNLSKEKNINCFVAYPDKRGTAIDYLEKLNIKTFHIKYGRWDISSNLNFIKKFKVYAERIIIQIIGLINIYKFRSIILKNNIDTVYSNTSVIFMGCTLKCIYNLKHIWHIREFMQEDHNLEFIYGDSLFNKCLNKYTDKIIFISKSISYKYEKNIYDKSKICIIYNDISKDFINPKENFNENDILKLAIIGTIQPGKGQLEVIKTVEKIINENVIVELHIAGKKSGEYYNKIYNYVEKKHLNKHIIFDGFIRNINEYRKNIDVGIVASSNEAFGRVTVEGMLSCMLMIGADTAGTSELIDNNINGFLYELHNVDDLKEKIYMINNDRKMLKRIALNGYNTAVKKYTTGQAAKKICKVIKEMDN